MKYILTKELKARWVKALRSKKYKQGKGRLKTGIKKPRYCCLGVLACVAKFKSSNNLLLKGKEDKFEFLRYSTQHSLADKNDKENYSFDKIADYIEKRL